MRFNKLVFYSLLVAVVIYSNIGSTTLAYSSTTGIEPNDLVRFKYSLYVSGEHIETKTLNVLTNNGAIRPDGLYEAVLGMKIGQVKAQVNVPAEKGYKEKDASYQRFIGMALVFRNIEILHVEGHSSPNGDQATNFEDILMIIAIAAIVVVSLTFLVFFFYRYGPKIFGKKCSNCKNLAVGNCIKCNKKFCRICYSNGCPNCKSKKMVVWKK